MIVLGYSGLDASVRHAREDSDLRPGEERIVQGLDSAAALLIDGRVVAAAAEERFSFEKHTNAFPRESILYCLKTAGLSPDEVDLVAHGFAFSRHAHLLSAGKRYEQVLDPQRQIELFHDKLDLPLPVEKFFSVPHHLAHAGSCCFPSGLDEALCVICDGVGEIESLSVYAFRSGGFELLDRFLAKDSLGILYGLVTLHLGFQFNADEYKVMGLAPYGDPERFRSFFDSIIEFRDHGRYSVDLTGFDGNNAPYYRGFLRHLADTVIDRPQTSERLPQRHCDFAAAAQECLEKLLFHVIAHWRQRTGLRTLCMAGGVALNCTFNGKLLDSRMFDQIYVQPAAGDDGTALGAAMIAARHAGEVLSPANHREIPFYGPSYSAEAIAAAVAREGGGLDVADLGSPWAAAADAAKALAEGEIIAWFQGRMEFGPRALGNRSILANPLLPDIKDRLNAVIKLREGFRPFAPAVAAERAAEYFDFVPSPMFDTMLATCHTRPEWRHRLPGVTHVDGSARMQTVDAARNGLFHRLIGCFGQLTGVHCVVNTSFNLRGQPVRVSPSVAIETFRKVRLARLYLGSLRLSKRD